MADVKTIHHPLKTQERYRTHLQLHQSYIKGTGIVLSARLVGLTSNGLEFEITGQSKSVVVHKSKRKSTGQEVLTFLQVTEDFKGRTGPAWELAQSLLAATSTALDETAESIIKE